MDCQNPQKILVIDDEIPILKLLSNILTRQGYKVDIAEGGKSGIQKVQSNSYNIIITDIIMPEKSGHCILREAKKTNGASLPVIGMSGTPWLLEDCPFDGILIKPFTREQLFDVINSVTVSS